MKKLILLSFAFTIFIFSSNQSFAQSPQQMNYQAVVRNTAGDVVPGGTSVALKFSIHNGTSTGTVVFTETQTTTTNQFGLVNLQIGTSNNLGIVDWGNGAKYLQVEASVNGAGYVDMGASQLISVPYALYAANSNVGPAGPMGPQGVPGPAGVSSQDTLIQLTKTLTTNELIMLQNGSAVQLLPPPSDTNFTYKLQWIDLDITAGTISLGASASSIRIGSTGETPMNGPFYNPTPFDGTITRPIELLCDHGGNTYMKKGKGVEMRIANFSVGGFNGSITIKAKYHFKK